LTLVQRSQSVALTEAADRQCAVRSAHLTVAVSFRRRQ